MKKIVCQLSIVKDNAFAFIEEFVMGLKDAISFGTGGKKWYEAYLVIELVNDITVLERIEAVERGLREKRYSKGEYVYQIASANQYGINLYTVPYPVGKEVFLFIPWSNIAGIYNYTEEEFLEMESEVKRLPFLHRKE